MAEVQEAKEIRAVTLAERFWSKVQKSEGCWLWIGCRHRQGYGKLHTGGKIGKVVPAHRISWGVNFGPISDGLWVLHKCDNPPCVRPDHLFLGDRKDNMVDCAQKGRLAVQKRLRKQV